MKLYKYLGTMKFLKLELDCSHFPYSKITGGSVEDKWGRVEGMTQHNNKNELRCDFHNPGRRYCC